MSTSPVPHVVVRGLCKTYRIPERRPGFRGALQSLVSRRHRTVEALADVSFTVGCGEVLGFIGQGLQAKTIAKVMGISLHTCRGYIKSAYTKLQVNNRRAAVRQALELDLIPGQRKP